MSQLPLRQPKPWSPLKKVDISEALKVVSDQIEKGWSDWQRIQIDLAEVRHELVAAGFPLSEEPGSVKKVEDFVLSLVNLLNWEGKVKANGDDWWVQIDT